MSKDKYWYYTYETTDEHRYQQFYLMPGETAMASYPCASFLFRNNGRSDDWNIQCYKGTTDYVVHFACDRYEGTSKVDLYGVIDGDTLLPKYAQDVQYGLGGKCVYR